jgi:hypothetical protein
MKKKYTNNEKDGRRKEIRNPYLMETDPHKVYKTTVVIMKRDQSSLVVVVLHLYSGGREIDFSTPLNGFFCPSAKFARISKKDPTVLKVD